MAFKIAEAFVRLFVDRSELKKGLREGKKDVEDFADSAKDFAKELGHELTRIVVPAGIAVAIVEAGKAAIESAAEMHNLAEETGFTVEQLSRLEYAASQPVEEFSGAIRSFNQKIIEAVQHGGQAEATFRSVGVSAQFLRAHTGDANAVLLKVADTFSRTSDGAGKVTVATDLFGARIGTKLIPTLNKGSAEIKRLGDESDRLGRTMTGETAANAEQFINRMNRLKQVLEGRLASPILSILSGIAVAFETVAYAANQVTIGLIRDFEVLRHTATLSFDEVLKDVQEWKDSQAELKKQYDAQIGAIKATGEAAAESGEKQKGAINPIIEAIEQANRQLAMSNVQLREQGAAAAHNAPLAEKLAREYGHMAAALLLHQKLDPALVAEKVALEEHLRVTLSLNAAEEQGRKLREHFMSEEVSLRGQILAIVLSQEDAERQAAIDTYELKKRQLLEQLREQTQLAHDTIKNEGDLQARLKEIRDKFSILDAENEALKIAKEIELNRKFGSSIGAIFDDLIHKEQTWGQDLIATVESIKAAIEANLGDALFAGITGHVEDVKAAFRSLVNAILHEIANLMAKQIVRLFIEKFLNGFSIPSGSVSTTGGYSGPTGIGTSTSNSGLFSPARLAPPASVGGLVGVGGGAPPVETHVTLLLAHDFIAGLRPAMLPSEQEHIMVIGSNILRNGQLRQIIKSAAR